LGFFLLAGGAKPLKPIRPAKLLPKPSLRQGKGKEEER